MASNGQAGPAVVNLLPSLFDIGGSKAFNASGRTVSCAVSPRDDSLAVYAAPNRNPHGLPSQNGVRHHEEDIYLVASQSVPSSERRVFLTDTSIIFSAFQGLTRNFREKDLQIFQSDEGMSAVRKLTQDYVNFCKECCIYTSSLNQSELQYEAEHYRKLYTCFSLMMELYVPEVGLEDAPVGDQLMEWLNTHFIEPSTEEGNQLSSQERPWEDERFWPYITRASLRGLTKASAFFLETLEKHPSPYLQRLSKTLGPLLSNHPRLHQFSVERDFVIAARRWKDKVKALRLELDRVPESERDDGFDNWWGHLSDVVGMLEGREEVVKRICRTLGGDWKEVCCAWGIFIDPRLRRKDLPEVVAEILDEMPPDPTDLEDMIHSSMFMGKPTEALADAARMDIWLAAHFADIMEPLDLIDATTDDSEISLRSHYILSYTEYMRTDPTLWRITVEYMCSCGPIGEDMADEVLMRVPLRLQNPKNAKDASEEGARIRAGNLAGVLKEIIATCFEHRRERVRRMVCRIAAQTFVKEREYGLAVSYCTSAEDWLGLGHVVDRVLEEYITQGPQQFARLVANIAPSLHSLRKEGGLNANGVFIYRLMFAVRFAEFHQRKLSGELQDAAFDLVAMFEEDVVPKSWWAVVLCDGIDLIQHNQAMLFTSSNACLLLHKLEEIHMRVAQGAKEDYIPILAKTTKSGGEKHAMQRLQAVRLALVRYYARCGVIGVGGKSKIGVIP